MRLRPGLRVGPYEVMAVLGAGGMAEVYRARDTRLGREIALKVVNEVLSKDPELVHRFEHEARLAGSLNHPNLVSVHDVGVHEGAPYFVTELLEGESLRHRLSRGRLPLSTALDWASQMASGLAAAHGKGVIHRDVKPENVFVTAEGKVKLLDFGIAKLAAASSAAGPHGLMDKTVTPTGGETATGTVIGTPGYMSPEQLRGEPLDARTDLFSLGTVLYEMLSGRRAFGGLSPVESGYGILHADPEPLPQEVPAAVLHVVQRCLEKEPARRFQSASDLAFALDVLRSPTGSAAPPIEPRPLRRRRAWVISATAVAAAIGLGALFVLRRPAPVPSPSAVLPQAEQITARWGTVNAARFLPDGRVVYSAAFEGRAEEVFVRPSGSPTAQALGLPDTSLLDASQSGELAVLIHPYIGLGFMPVGTVARVPSVGGIPREVAEKAKDAAWSPGGDIAIVRPSGLGHVLEFPPGHVLFRTDGWISHFRFSPGGERIALLHHPVPFDDMGEVMVLDLNGRARTLTKRWPTSWGLAWSPNGTEVWFTAGILGRDTLHSVTLAGSTRELYRSLGELCLEDVAADGRVLLKSGLRRIEVAYRSAGNSSETLLSWADWNAHIAALSADGKILFSAMQPKPLSEGLQRAWVLLRSKDGSPAQVLGEGYVLDLSADGRWALAVSEDKKNLTALPTGAGQTRTIPVRGFEFSGLGVRWAPDGKTILAAARPEGAEHFYLYRLAEDGSAVRVSETGLDRWAFLEVSADGRWAAALDEQMRTVVISLPDGTARQLALPSRELVLPRRWSREGHLWVTEGSRWRQARTRLLRLDPQTGKVLEERSIGPADPGGVGPIGDVQLSADGQDVAFSYSRDLSRLYVVKGLER